MSEEQYVDSLERDIEIIRDQIALARAVGANAIAVPLDRLERLLNEIENHGWIEGWEACLNS